MDFWLILGWILLSLVFGYLKLKYSYWELRGFKQVKTHFLFGKIQKLKSLHLTDLTQEVYDEFKGKAKVAGTYMFTQPVAVILDLDVVKAVLIKDFNKFTSRMKYKNEKDILSQHLFNLEGPLWKPLRSKLTPTFTSGKMKFMFPSIKKVAEEFARTYERSIEESDAVNITDLNARYTVDVIGTCIFGIECNSLKDPSAEFRQIAAKIFGRTDFNVRWHLFKQTYVELMKFIGFKRYPQLIENFFRRIIREGIMEREKLGIYRNDFVDLLLELKRSPDMNLSYDQIAAQFFVFFAAGFETSSTTMSNVLFELGRHPEIQEKLRREILATLKKYDQDLTYECLMDMKYLDQVITETLRLYPPVRYLQRVSSETFNIPGTQNTLDKDIDVFIPVWAIHRDPDVYENPKEFLPERFSAEEVAKRHPQAFLGFGDGPRNCIGLRLGRMQTKAGLISLLSKYKFSHSSKTCEEIEVSNHSLVVIPVKGIWLKVERM